MRKRFGNEVTSGWATARRAHFCADRRLQFGGAAQWPKCIAFAQRAARIDATSGKTSGRCSGHRDGVGAIVDAVATAIVTMRRRGRHSGPNAIDGVQWVSNGEPLGGDGVCGLAEAQLLRQARRRSLRHGPHTDSGVAC